MTDRLAIVGPMPPVPSGIADYNSRVIDALLERYDVTVFDPMVRPDSIGHSDAPVPVLAARALGSIVDPGEFASIIYTFGNNEHHHASYDLLQRVPGVVWLHDVRMTGLHLSYSWGMDPEERLRHDRAVLERQYGAPLPKDMRDPSTWTVEHFEDRDMYMSWELTRLATRVLVNSTFARDLLVRDLGEHAEGMDIRILPFGIPDAEVSTPRTTTRDLIVSPGFVTPVKLPELLLEAFAQSHVRDSHRLAFVGDVRDEHRTELMAKASRLGVADRVVITGFASADYYARCLDRAGCTVLLRRTTQGESSAAVADCLVHAAPTVTNIPSTRDFDSPLLHHLDGIPDVTSLAQAIEDATDTPAASRTIDPGFAAEHSFAGVAKAMMEAVT